jgi:hypothetical protein
VKLSCLEVSDAVPANDDLPIVDGGKVGEPLIQEVENRFWWCAPQGNKQRKSTQVIVLAVHACQPRPRLLDMEEQRGAAMDMLAPMRAGIPHEYAPC